MAKSVLVLRCGGIGDMLEAGSVCAGFKRQGYRVGFCGNEPNVEALYNNPNIDEFVPMNDKGKTPEELSKEWFALGAKYDRYVPLAQIVECTLLARPEFVQFHVAPAARHLLCNHNYLEVLHLSAGLPHIPDVHFYPTDEEMAWALDLTRSFRDYPTLLLVTHGSGVSKMWPHTETFIRRALERNKDLHIIMTGGEIGQLLEEPWKGHGRVHRTSGQIKQRQYLTLPFVVDAILGPETGIFYASALMEVPKIILLSMGSPENLTRDWVNIHPVWAENVTCKGRGKNEAPFCHQVHDNWSTCTRVIDQRCADCRSGRCSKHLSACQQAIGPEKVLAILGPILERARENRQVAA